MSIKSLFTQVHKTSTQYHAEFMLDNGEYARLCTIRTLSVDQLAAIRAINEGTATRQDISTAINAIKRYALITISTGELADMRSYAKASI